jgi:hypothetical protein
MLYDHWNLIYHITFHIPDITKHVPLIVLNFVYKTEYIQTKGREVSLHKTNYFISMHAHIIYIIVPIF